MRLAPGFSRARARHYQTHDPRLKGERPAALWCCGGFGVQDVAVGLDVKPARMIEPCRVFGDGKPLHNYPGFALLAVGIQVVDVMVVGVLVVGGRILRLWRRAGQAASDQP